MSKFTRKEVFQSAQNLIIYDNVDNTSHTAYGLRTMSFLNTFNRAPRRLLATDRYSELTDAQRPATTETPSFLLHDRILVREQNLTTLETHARSEDLRHQLFFLSPALHDGATELSMDFRKLTLHAGPRAIVSTVLLALTALVAAVATFAYFGGHFVAGEAFGKLGILLGFLALGATLLRV